MVSCGSPSHVDSNSEYENTGFVEDKINQKVDDLQLTFDEFIETVSSRFSTYSKFSLVKANPILFNHVPDRFAPELSKPLNDVIKTINDNVLEYDGCFFDLSSLLSSGDYLHYYAGGRFDVSEISTYLDNMYREVLKTEYNHTFNLRELVKAANYGDKGTQKKLFDLVCYNVKEMHKVVPESFGVIGYDPFEQMVILQFNDNGHSYFYPFTLNEFKLTIPFANNLLEECLFIASNGSVSLENIKYNTMAKRYFSDACDRTLKGIKNAKESEKKQEVMLGN